MKKKQMTQDEAKRRLKRNFFMEALRREIRQGKYDDYRKYLK